MNYGQIGKAKLYQLGAWLAEDPRRFAIIVTAVTVLSTVAVFALTSAHTAVLIAGNSTGGGGG